MAIKYFEMMTVAGERITADLIIWRRYKCRAPGMFEALLDYNPHLAHIHRASPFIPPGVQILIPIDPDLLQMKPRMLKVKEIWGDWTQRKGYTL